MALETGTYVSDLVITNPVGSTDKVKFGDDHLKLIKTVLQNTFPNAAGRSFRIQSKGVGYTVAANDTMSVIRCTAAITLSLTAAATLTNGHMFAVIASNGAVIIDPNGAELVNGAATQTLADGESGIVFCDGSAFYMMAVPQKTVTQAEAEAGTGTTGRLWTPQRVSQAIVALTPLLSLGLTNGGLKSAGFTAVINTRYHCVFGASGTITGPAAATAGDIMAFALAGAYTYTFAPNGLKVNSSTANLPIPGNQTLIVEYTGATDGWV